jgi:hypothetical protein
MGQQRAKLARRSPRAACRMIDPVYLASCRKGMLVNSEGNKPFEVIGFRITVAGLPVAYGATRRQGSRPIQLASLIMVRNVSIMPKAVV